MENLAFTCLCGGKLIKIGEKDGRVFYNCDTCKNNELLECTICRNPRSVWADDGEICGLCYLKWMEGTLFPTDSRKEGVVSFTDEQIAGILKWRIKI